MELHTLDVAGNQIQTLENMAHLQALRTLNLTGNRLHSVADVAELTKLPGLQSLDVSKNRIDDPAAVELLWALPGLTLLRLEGNPVVHKIPHYRKMTISRMPHLNYLDDSPVFAKDRRLAEAFARGGLEEEKAERERFKQEAEATEARHR